MLCSTLSIFSKFSITLKTSFWRNGIAILYFAIAQQKIEINNLLIIWLVNETNCGQQDDPKWTLSIFLYKYLQIWFYEIASNSLLVTFDLRLTCAFEGNWFVLCHRSAIASAINNVLQVSREERDGWDDFPPCKTCSHTQQ